MSDFTPIGKQITLHGLGFLQVKLQGNLRMHVWHPDLPKRKCFGVSPIHNHRFSFESRVLVGTQINERYDVRENVRTPTHDKISHDGPRRPTGSRASYVCGEVSVAPFPKEFVGPGESYRMPIGQYHRTVDNGIVVTVMQKLSEGNVHANSLIEKSHTFDQEFDRFQLSDQHMMDIVMQSLLGGNE